MPDATYLIEPAGIADAIARARPDAKHAQLIAAIRRAEPRLNGVVLGAIRGGYWNAKRKVVSASGDLVADDHVAWLRDELAADGGDGARTAARLRPLDLRLTQCDLVKLYLVHDRGGRQQDFVQLDVDQQDEFVHRRFFSSWDTSWRKEPEDLAHLVELAEEGEPLADEARKRYRDTEYRLRRAVDFAAFLDEAVAVEGANRAIKRQRTIMVTDVVDTGIVNKLRPVSIAALDPEGARYAWNGQRLVDDWTDSSAGRSGARLCRHWVFQFADHTSRKGERTMDFVPVWTFVPKIAEMKRPPASDYALYGKLEAIDRRTGVPMGWYFWMLHGNRVGHTAGLRVLAALQAGRLVLPEHDYQVLRRWGDRTYGF